MQNKPVTIREMVEQDLPGNHELQNLQMQYHLEWMGPIDYDWINSEECTQRTRNFIVNEDHFALVAEQAGKQVGFLLGNIIKNHPTSLNKIIGELCSLFVHEDARGSGVGRRLCEMFNGFCLDRGVSLISVIAASSNYPTHDFYHRLGYKDYSLTMRLHIPDKDD